MLEASVNSENFYHTCNGISEVEKEIKVKAIFEDILEQTRILQNRPSTDGRRITNFKQEECQNTNKQKETYTHIHTHTLKYILVKVVKKQSTYSILKEAQGNKIIANIKFNIQKLMFKKKKDIFRYTKTTGMFCNHHPVKATLKVGQKENYLKNK